MSIQNIIDRAQQIEIDRKKFVGQTMSRSQRIKTSERSTAQPWRFKITPPGALKWADSRGFIELIDTNDRINEYEISLNNNAAMNYITAYQGSLTAGQRDNLLILSSTTSSLTLTNLPAITGTITSSTIILAAGDFIQPANSRYPYTVTTNVVRGANTTTNVTLNRPVITSEGISLIGQPVNIGNNCTWQVVVATLPTYQLIPNRLVQYTGDFELIEKII
jgi:hypothetical protein